MHAIWAWEDLIPAWRLGSGHMALAWPVIRELTILRERLNELVSGALAGPGAGNPSATASQPVADIFEDDDHVVVIMEVPGVVPESLDLQIQGSRLRVSGRCRRSQVGPGERFVRLERTDGAFSREVVIPLEVAADEPAAELQDGVLSLRVPKALHLRRHMVEVRKEPS